MTDNNKHENKTEELIKKQEARQLTVEDLEQVTGGTRLGEEKGDTVILEQTDSLLVLG